MRNPFAGKLIKIGPEEVGSFARNSFEFGDDIGSGHRRDEGKSRHF
jgi:hypothetical protein